MATTIATDQGTKGVIVPPRRYEVRLVWILDQKTLVPVEVRQELVLA